MHNYTLRVVIRQIIFISITIHQDFLSFSFCKRPLLYSSREALWVVVLASSTAAITTTNKQQMAEIVPNRHCYESACNVMMPYRTSNINIIFLQNKCGDRFLTLWNGFTMFYLHLIRKITKHFGLQRGLKKNKKSKVSPCITFAQWVDVGDSFFI